MLLFKVVIPARYASTRLAGKPLLPIAGKPMLAHVCQQALQSGAEQVLVATDDKRIANAARDWGVDVVMTSTSHQSGSERIGEVASIQGWADDSIVVNLQGDEPLMPPQYIQLVAQSLAAQSEANIATIAAPISTYENLHNPNIVKVTLDKNNHALYFSRAPIPYDRDSCNTSETYTLPSPNPYLHHIGLYAYRVQFLRHYCALAPSQIESIESLEQLRILWHGEPILVTTVPDAPAAGVDTVDDLQRVELILKSNKI